MEKGDGCHANFGESQNEERSGEWRIRARICTCAAPTALEVRGNGAPALTRWANVFRASGAETCASKRTASEGGPYQIPSRA